MYYLVPYLFNDIIIPNAPLINFIAYNQ